VLITRWSDLWNRHVAKDPAARGMSADPLLIIGWLLNNTLNLTPFETTLKIWAALAGDALGASPTAAVEAYLRRMQAGQPDKNRAALEQLAAQMVLGEQTVLAQEAAQKWLGGSDIQAAEPDIDEAVPSNGKRGEAAKRVRARGALPDLIDCGLLAQHYGERLRLRHPLLTAFLAAQKFTPLRGGSQIAGQLAWGGRSSTLHFMALIDPQASWLGAFLKEDDDDPLQRNLLQIGRWLRAAPEDLAWVSPVMRRLTSLLSSEKSPLTLRLRALAALTLSGNSGLPVMLRQLSTSPNPDLRQMAALGLGMIRDAKALPDLLRMVNERIPQVYRAAILALTALGESQGLEAVAGLLLSGDASQSRAAAESLANHIEEGHPTLEEASRMEDPGVRRAAAFGLARIHQAWAAQILEKLRAEDPQWIVQDAAIQALQTMREESPRLPRLLPAPTQLAWLNAFAAERGMGVAPGKPAAEMLYRSLGEGTDEQALAAIYYLKARGDESSLIPLLQVYQIKSGDLRAGAFEALHSLAARGFAIPALSQFGLRT
jgi:HEAT repeat protein